MKKLKRSSLYDNLHFLAFGVILFILTLKLWWFVFILIAYLVFIYQKTELFYLLLSLLFLFGISYLRYLPKEMPYQFEGVVVDTNDYSVEVLTKEGRIQVFGKHQLELGDYGKFNTSDYHFSNSGFNYEAYLENKGIKASRELETVVVMDNYFVFAMIQAKLKELVVNSHPLIGNYLVTLLLGDNFLEDELNNDLLILGISHLLAISGLHITILVNLFVKLLDKLFYFERPKEIIVTIFLLIYIVITNFSTSVVRAALMVILKYYFKSKKDLFTKLDILSMITIGVLLVNPKTFFLIGFELSYLISFIMITFIPMLKKSNVIINSLKISFVAFMVSLPIVINFNFQLNLLTLIASPLYSFYFELLLIPISVVILFFPFIEKYVLIFFNLFEKSISYLKEIKLFTFVFGKLNSFEVFVYYLLLFLLFMFFFKKTKRRILIWILSLYIAVIYGRIYLNPYGKVIFYDVGQGDSILISLPHGQGNILVDCYNNITTLLKRDGVKKIDYLIITHGHSDHVGAIDEVITNYQIKKIYTSKFDNTGLLDMNYNFDTLASDDEITFKNLKLKIISPIEAMVNENNNSLVIQFTLEDITYLLTGDIESDAERLLALKYQDRLNCDVLKVAHHGSDTSSSDLFLKYAKPSYFIISVGYNNIYHLPNHLKLLSLKNLYRTDYDGTIYFYQKNGKLFVKKEGKND